MAVNFLDQWKSPKGTIGAKAWNSAIAAGYSPSQIKVAVQQQNQAGVGVNNAPGQFFHSGGPMKGVPGMHSPKNPLGKYQGPGGNLGLNFYNAAKNAGFSPADIPMLAAQGGMFLPTGAQSQWEQDMMEVYAPPEMPEFEMPGATSNMGGGAVLGSSAMGIRSALGSQDNTGGTGEAFGRKKKKLNISNQLQINPLT